MLRLGLLTDGALLPLSPADLDCIVDVLRAAWSAGTLGMYGTGVLVFHVFCNGKAVAKELCATASTVLMTVFLAAVAGLYSGATLARYFYRVWAWHIIHGMRWVMDDDTMSTMLKAVRKLTPPGSKRDARIPLTIELILAIRLQLDLSLPVSPAHQLICPYLLSSNTSPQ